MRNDAPSESLALTVIYRGEYHSFVRPLPASVRDWILPCPLCGFRLWLFEPPYTFTPDAGGVSVSPSLVCPLCDFHAIVTRGVMTDVPLTPEAPPMRTPDELKMISADDWTLEERQRGLMLAEETALAIVKEKTGEFIAKAGAEYKAVTDAVSRLIDIRKQRTGLTATPQKDGVVVDDASEIVAPAGAETAILPFSTDTASPPYALGAPAAPPAEMATIAGDSLPDSPFVAPLSPAPTVTAPMPVNLIKPSAAVAEDPAVDGAIAPAPPKEYGLQLIGREGISPDVSNAKIQEIAKTLAAVSEMADIGATAAIVWDGDDLAGVATYTETVGWVVRVPRP